MSTPFACSMTARDSMASRMFRACSPSWACASAFASPESLRAGLDTAEVVAVAVVNADSHWKLGEQARNMRLAMDSRAVIEQAKGVLMAQRHVDAEQAFEILRDASQRYNRKLRDIALGIVESTQDR